MNKDQSVLAKEIKVFASKEILLQHSVSSYRIDLSFPMIKIDGTIFGRGRAYIWEAYIPEEKYFNFQSVNLFPFSFLLWHISRGARYEICSKLTIKIPKYIS